MLFSATPVAAFAAVSASAAAATASACRVASATRSQASTVALLPSVVAVVVVPVLLPAEHVGDPSDEEETVVPIRSCKTTPAHCAKLVSKLVTCVPSDCT